MINFNSLIARSLNKLSHYTKSLFNLINYCTSYINPVNPNLSTGLSFLIKAKNEDVTIKACIESIAPFADEIIVIDNNSTDDTPNILANLEQKYGRNFLKIYQDTRNIVPIGKTHKTAVKNGKTNTLTYLTNNLLEKATFNNVISWDADKIAHLKNLTFIIDKLKLRKRKDKFCVFFNGVTLYLDNNTKLYQKLNNDYCEYSVFSKRHGINWVDDEELLFEISNPKYVYSCFKRYVIQYPCFYEIKTTFKDEFQIRDSYIFDKHKRIVEDKDNIEILKRNILPANVKPFQNNYLENLLNLK